MQNYTYYFLQAVQAQEINSSFTGVETAINRLHTDLGMVGVLIGGSVNQYSTPNLTVDVSAGVVIDQTGQRIRWSSIENLNCALDEDNVSTAVGSPGNSKYLSIFAKFLRAPSDPRVDGERQTIYFNQGESFELRVAQGAEAVSPTPPALRSDQILLADILIDFGKTQIFDADIDMVTRRQWAITASSAALTIARGQIDDAFQDVADAIAAGTADLADQTTPDDGATLVGADTQTSGLFSVSQGTLKAQILELLGHTDTVNAFANSGNWHDGTGITATDVEAAINEVKNDLASENTGNGGADRVGSATQTVGSASVAAGSIWDQIAEMLAYLDASVDTARAVQMMTGTGYLLSAAIGTTSPATKDVQDLDIDPSSGTYRWGAVCDDGLGNTNSSEVRTSSRLFEGWVSGGTFGSATVAMYGLAWSPDLSLWCAVGQRSPTSAGASVETNSTLSGIWTTQSPTGMQASGDYATRVIWDPYNDELIVVGYPGTSSHSSDGSTWYAPTTAPPSGVLLNSLAVNPNNGSVIATQLTPVAVYRTADGGDNWANVSTGVPTSGNLSSVAYDPKLDRFWVVGSAGIAISDNNEGTSWTDVTPTNSPDATSAYRGVAVSPDGIVVVEDREFIYITLDGGTTWSAWDVSTFDGAFFGGALIENFSFLGGRFIGGYENKILIGPAFYPATDAT